MSRAELLHYAAVHADILFFSVLGLLLSFVTLWYRISSRIGTVRSWQLLQTGAVFAGLLSFGLIASRVESEALNTIDTDLSVTVRMHATPALLAFFHQVTHFGDSLTLAVICACVFATLYLSGRIELALGSLIAIAGNALLNNVLKAYFHRLRPLDAELTTWSFPSGHSSGSMVTYGIIAYLAIRLLPPKYHLPVLLLSVTIVFATGSSRVYLGVHYVSDVVAGFATGLCWLMLTLLLLESRLRR